MKVGRSWGFNLWVTCKKLDQNRTFFMDFGTFSKFDEKWDFWTSMRKYAWGEVLHLSSIKINFFKFHQKNAPKSMKNVRFWFGFLHMILKLIHQKDYNKKITLTTFVREKTSKSPYSRACCHGPVRGRAPNNNNNNNKYVS